MADAPRQTTLFSCGVTSGKATSATSIKQNRQSKNSKFGKRDKGKPSACEDQNQAGSSKGVQKKRFDRNDLKKSDNLIVSIYTCAEMFD